MKRLMNETDSADGTAAGILKTKQRLADEQVTEIRQRWRDFGSFNLEDPKPPADDAIQWSGAFDEKNRPTADMILVYDAAEKDSADDAAAGILLGCQVGLLLWILIIGILVFGYLIITGGV